jgi:hypothetical protein
LFHGKTHKQYQQMGTSPWNMEIEGSSRWLEGHSVNLWVHIDRIKFLSKVQHQNGEIFWVCNRVKSVCPKHGGWPRFDRCLGEHDDFIHDQH